MSWGSELAKSLSRLGAEGGSCNGVRVPGSMATRRFIKANPEELAIYIKSLARGLVVFDGRPGSGKTYLAEKMARRVGCASAAIARSMPLKSSLNFMVE